MSASHTTAFDALNKWKISHTLKHDSPLCQFSNHIHTSDLYRSYPHIEIANMPIASYTPMAGGVHHHQLPSRRAHANPRLLS